jgi:hypothetical protein
VTLTIKDFMTQLGESLQKHADAGVLIVAVSTADTEPVESGYHGMQIDEIYYGHMYKIAFGRAANKLLAKAHKKGGSSVIVFNSASMQDAKLPENNSHEST